VMHAIAAILIVVGFLAGLVGDWMILVRAYRYGTAWFVGCLLLPVAGWVFACFAMPRPALPLTLSVGGTLLAVSGWLVIHMGA
jgi:hypothetical protein